VPSTAARLVERYATMIRRYGASGALRKTDTVFPQLWTRAVGDLKLVDEGFMAPINTHHQNKLFHNLKHSTHAGLAAFVITECEKRAAAAGYPFAHAVGANVRVVHAQHTNSAAGCVRMEAQRGLQHLDRLSQHRAHEGQRRRRPQQRVQRRPQRCLE